MSTKTPIEKLNNLIDIQCSDGNWNYDAYMQGMANGMILARSVFTDEDPQFLEAPKAWLSDKPAFSPTEAHLRLVSQSDGTDKEGGE